MPAYSLIVIDSHRCIGVWLGSLTVACQMQGLLVQLSARALSGNNPGQVQVVYMHAFFY